MARVSDYAARVARARAAGYASLSAQRTAQAHARGFTSRAAEIAAAKQPLIDEVIQHFADVGAGVRPSGMRRNLIRRQVTYKKLRKMRDATLYEIQIEALDDDDWHYH